MLPAERRSRPASVRRHDALWTRLANAEYCLVVGPRKNARPDTALVEIREAISILERERENGAGAEQAVRDAEARVTAHRAKREDRALLCQCEGEGTVSTLAPCTSMDRDCACNGPNVEIPCPCRRVAFREAVEALREDAVMEAAMQHDDVAAMQRYAADWLGRRFLTSEGEDDGR